MLIRTRLSGWIALYADDCGRCFESRRSDRAWEFVERIISAGPINSSRPRDCSLRLQPGSWRANPDEETPDWRAVCGRTARTVRRAGTAKAVSDPYRFWNTIIIDVFDFPQLAAAKPLFAQCIYVPLVRSHQFLSKSLKINFVVPLALSSMPSSVMPLSLPLVANSRWASSTCAVDAICNVKRFTGARY